MLASVLNARYKVQSADLGILGTKPCFYCIITHLQRSFQTDAAFFLFSPFFCTLPVRSKFERYFSDYLVKIELDEMDSAGLPNMGGTPPPIRPLSPPHGGLSPRKS